MTHPTGTRDARVEQPLDPATIVRMVQGVSGEIVLEKLMERVLVLALEHAGWSCSTGLTSAAYREDRATSGGLASRATVTSSLRSG